MGTFSLFYVSLVFSPNWDKALCALTIQRMLRLHQTGYPLSEIQQQAPQSLSSLRLKHVL